MTPDAVALVTGASRGLGAAVARDLAGRGVRIGLLARDRRRLLELASELGAAAFPLPADVTDLAAVESSAQELEKALGPLTVVVSNAAVLGPIAPLVETDPSRWADVMTVNVVGAYHVLRAVLPRLMANGGGQILGITSGAAHNTLRFHSAYNTSKAAFEHLHRMADAEARAAGVHVALFDPGGMDTEMFREVVRAKFPERELFRSSLERGAVRPAERVARVIGDLLADGVEPAVRYSVDELLSDVAPSRRTEHPA